MNTPENEIIVCMGSSCFSRGNNINADIIGRFLVEHRLEGHVTVQGCLCNGHCKSGPNIKVNGELLQGVKPEMITDLLAHKLIRG